MSGLILALDPGKRVQAGKPNPSAKRRWQGGARVVLLRCDGCGADYIEYAARAARAKRHFCGSACYRAHRAGPGNPKWRGGRQQRNCATCGAAFSRDPHEIAKGEGTYCSNACLAQGRKKHPSAVERRREANRRREARERAARRAMPHHTRAEWLALLEAYGNRCAACGSTDRLERDHIIPLSRGGTDAISNIQPLCKRCNCSKHARLMHEWRQGRRHVGAGN